MSHPLDVYDDSNQQQLYTIDRLCGLPDFVKKAQIDDKAELPSLPTSSFADPCRRKFPCHNKSAAYLANAYFQQAKPLYKQAEATMIQARLNKFATYWGISGIVSHFNKNWTKIASMGTPDMKDQDYALVYEADGETFRRMPMPNVVSVKMAGEYLYANRHNYTYAMRKSAARKILRKAMDYDKRAGAGEKFAGAELGALRFSPEAHSYLERAAGLGAGHPQWAAEKVAQRMIMLGETHPDYRIKLAELAEYIHGLEAFETDSLDKFASMIDAIDRETGLANHYHSGVELPEEMFFQVLEKEASSILESHVKLQTGKVYPIEAFLSIPLEKISEVMGQEFADAVQSSHDLSIDPVKFAAIAPTLPRGDAALLEAAIEAASNSFDKSAARKGPGAAGLKYDQKSIKKLFEEEGHEDLGENDFNMKIKLNHKQKAK